LCVSGGMMSGPGAATGSPASGASA
jgi:hypothetical protein